MKQPSWLSVIGALINSVYSIRRQRGPSISRRLAEAGNTIGIFFAGAGYVSMNKRPAPSSLSPGAFIYKYLKTHVPARGPFTHLLGGGQGLAEDG